MRTNGPEQDPIEPAITAVPTPSQTPPPADGIDVDVAYPDSTVVLLSVGGALDAASVGRLEHTLWPRLAAAVQLVVLDLAPLEFLGVDGLDLLNQARERATARGISLRLVATHPEVQRALQVAGLDLPCYESLHQALHESDGPEPGTRSPGAAPPA